MQIDLATLGMIGGALVSIFTLGKFAYNWLRAPYNELKQDYDKLNTRLTDLEKSEVATKTKIENMKQNVGRIEEDQEALDKRVIDKIDRIEEKFDKFIDILIKHHSNG